MRILKFFRFLCLLIVVMLSVSLYMPDTTLSSLINRNGLSRYLLIADLVFLVLLSVIQLILSHRKRTLKSEKISEKSTEKDNQVETIADANQQGEERIMQELNSIKSVEEKLDYLTKHSFELGVNRIDAPSSIAVPELTHDEETYRKYLRMLSD